MELVWAADDFHRDSAADQRGRPVRRGPAAARASGRRSGRRGGPGRSNSTCTVRPTQSALKAACCSRSSACSSCSRASFSASATWPAAPAAGVPGRAEYLKLNAWAKPTARTRSSVAAKIRVGLAGMADDEVGRQRDVRPRRAQALDDAAVVGGRVAPVHRRQHAVGAGLHRQMQERHELRHLGVRRDQVVVHVARVRGGVADAQQPRDVRQCPDQPAERRLCRPAPRRARRSRSGRAG